MSGTRLIHFCILSLLFLFGGCGGCDGGSGAGPECHRDDDCPDCYTCHLGECQPAKEICGDGVDNDCDQATDYDDDECTMPTPKLEVCVRVDASDPNNLEITCSPPYQVDFGPVELAPLGEPVSTPVILRNLGDKVLTIQGVRTADETSAEFSAETADLPVQIPAVGSDGIPDESTVMVRYSPEDGGRDEGILEISSDDPDNGLVEVQLGGGGVAPRLCAEPALLDFGGITVGHTIRRNVALTNCGLSTLRVGLFGFLDPTSPDFAFGALPLTPFDLAPGEGVEIPVLYTPADIGSDEGMVYVQSNDPSTETGFLIIHGEGTNDSICDIEVEPGLLNFGTVEAGQTANQTAFIRNTGTQECVIIDITGPTGPGASAFALSSLPMTPFGMGPGQERSMAVRYTPQDQGPHRATVEIVSDDFQGETFQVNLYGNDPNAPECDLEIVPTHVAFGLVAMWRTSVQSVEINNRGTRGCTLHSIQWDPRSDHEFTIAQAPSLPTQIPPRARAEILIGFNPIRRGLYSAELVIVTDDPGTPVVNVTMNATAEELNLIAIPDSVDFGTVNLECDAAGRTIIIYSMRISGVEINDVYLDGSRTDPSKYQISALTFNGAPATTPLYLPPTGSLSIDVHYTPAAVESDTGILVIESNDAIDGSMEVPMIAAGTDVLSQTDVFEQPSEPIVDVLWVVDNSGSMIPQQNALATNFAAFIQWAVFWQIDFHLGVIATEINQPEIPGDYFNIYPGVLVQYPGFPKVITNTTPNLAQAFTKNINVGTCCSDEQEAGLHAATMALSEPLVTSTHANAGFLRDEAKLAIIIVSDEVDQSPAPPDFYADFLKNIKGVRNDEMMEVSVVVGDVPSGCSWGGISAEASPRYKYVQEETGGVFQSHCSPDWRRMMDALGQHTFAPRRKFPLTRPADPATIEVTVDTHDGNGPQPVPEDTNSSGDGWSYDSDTNSIAFGTDAVPGPGATINVSYQTICP